MASVFSYYIASFLYPSDPHDQLNQPPRAGRYSRSFQHILNSGSTKALTSLLVATIVQSRLPQSISSPHGTAADDADVPMREPRRFL